MIPCYPLDSGLGGPQSWSGHWRVEKIFFPLLGIEPIIVSNELSGLPQGKKQKRMPIYVIIQEHKYKSNKVKMNERNLALPSELACSVWKDEKVGYRGLL
jgi:hypothetical protein